MTEAPYSPEGWILHNGPSHRYAPRHATEEEYRVFLESHTAGVRWKVVRDKLGTRRRFVRAYPELEEWFRAPLAERLGRIFSRGEDGHVDYFHNRITSDVCFWARPYLFFLATQGYLRFDWEWLVATRRLNLGNYRRYFADSEAAFERLVGEAGVLGIDEGSTRRAVRWTFTRVFLHTGVFDVASVGEAELDSLSEALEAFARRLDLELFYDSPESFQVTLHHYHAHLYRVRTILYQRGQIGAPPLRVGANQRRGPSQKPRMEEVAERYLAAVSPTVRASTLATKRNELRQFIDWVAQVRPNVESFAEVDRDLVLEYIQDLAETPPSRTGKPLAPATRQHKLGALACLFRDTADWGWEGVPGRPLLTHGDFPRRPRRVPRFIPKDELEPLMEAIRALPCPYQRTALLVARWSGARRDEIRRLEFDCLDSYLNGLARLRIPAGKTDEERMVPLNEEGADAIRKLQRISRPGRGVVDPMTGRPTRYLFSNRGRPFSSSYLFDTALRTACEAAGLLWEDGGPGVTAHRFRHTLGTELAESGARLHTIMSVLGHRSPGMSIVYARISDEAVKEDYEKILGPGATIAGPIADTLRAGELSDATVDWLKTNFFKTELELGHCLRLPQEGPCECDLYLACPKFVTTAEYVPRLRARREKEFTLIENAISNGWEREVERHRCSVRRIDQLLADLNEPLEEEKER